jgi:uncharacterized membrane protein
MLHITGAFLLVGGSVAAGVLNVLAQRSERPSEAALFLRLIKFAAVPLIGIGVITTFIFGVWLWHHQGYGLGTAWIWASVVLWAVSNELGRRGGKYQDLTRKYAEELAAAGDVPSEELRARLRDRRGNALSWLAGAATLAILVLMIWKPGS